MFSDNIHYEKTEPFNFKLIDGSEKQILNESYTKREIDVIVGRKHILSDLSDDFGIIKMNKLAKVIDMIFNLNELDNSGNLKDGRPSDALFMYYVSSSKDFMHFESQTPQYKKSSKMVRLFPALTKVLHFAIGKPMAYHGKFTVKRTAKSTLANYGKTQSHKTPHQKAVTCKP